MQLNILHTEAAELLVQRLQTRAAASPFNFSSTEVDAAKLTRLPSEFLMDNMEPVEAPLPSMIWWRAFELRSATLGTRTILVGTVETRDLLAESWNTLLRGASYLRANLDDDSAQTDLYLFVVAPPGTNTSEGWLRTARTIERSEQICRKYVWLPPSGPNDFGVMADNLLNRTFLTSPVPIEDEVTNRATDLGPLDTALLEYGILGRLPQTAIREWTRILNQAPVPGRAVALDLISAVEGDSNE